MRRFGIVYLDQTDPLEAANSWSNVSAFIAWDREADTMGAPQNVAALHGLLALGKPVWYRGGMETVHTAELVVGLGCEKVIVGNGFFKTERTPEHFVRRLGEACVVVVKSAAELKSAWNAGALWAYTSNDAESDDHILMRSDNGLTSWGIALSPD